MYQHKFSSIIFILIWMYLVEQHNFVVASGGRSAEGCLDATSNDLEEPEEIFLNNREFLDKDRTILFSKFANQIRENNENIYKSSKINSIVGGLMNAPRKVKTTIESENRTKRSYTYDYTYYYDNQYFDAAAYCGYTSVDMFYQENVQGAMYTNTMPVVCSSVADYGGFQTAGSSRLSQANNCLRVNSYTSNPSYNIAQTFYQTFDSGKNFQYLNTALEQTNKYLSVNVMNSFTSIEEGQVRIDERLRGIDKKLDKRIDEVNQNLVQMRQENEHNFLLVQKAIQKGFNQMSEQSSKQYKSIIKRVNSGFDAMTKVMRTELTKVTNQIDNLKKSIDDSVIEHLRVEYILNFNDDITLLMERYRAYIKFPTCAISRNDFIDMCKQKGPSTLVMTLVRLFSAETMKMLLANSRGRFDKLKSLLVYVSSDAGNLVALVPACNAFKDGDPCENNFETISKMTDLVKFIIKFMQDYDAQPSTRTALRESFKNSIVKFSKIEKYKFYNVSEKRPFDKRKEFADGLLTVLRSSNPFLHFTVIVENPTEDDIEADSYVAQNLQEKLMIFTSKHFDFTVPNIKVFWHRTEHQPQGRMWTTCIDEQRNCWHDGKPHCTIKGLSAKNPFHGKAITSDTRRMCFSDAICRIRRPLATVPECSDGKACFRKCSDFGDETIYSDSMLTSAQYCYNQQVPCVYKNPICVQIGINNFEAYFPNSSYHVAINGDQCQKHPQSLADLGTQLDKYRYIGGYQTTSCVTDLQQESVQFSKRTGSAHIDNAIVKATNYDCTTIFSFPQPGNIIEYAHAKDPSKTQFLYKNWKFNDLKSIGDHIEKHHEMKDLGYCLLGISRTWLDQRKYSLNRPAMATDMNGVSEHYWGSSSELKKFSSTHPNDGNKHAHLIYIVHNCGMGKNNKLATDDMLADYLEECRKKTSETNELATEVTREHEEFLVEVKNKEKAIVEEKERKRQEEFLAEQKKRMKKVGIAIGAVLVCLLLLGIAGLGTFYVLSRRQMSMRRKQHEGKHDHSHTTTSEYYNSGDTSHSRKRLESSGKKLPKKWIRKVPIHHETKTPKGTSPSTGTKKQPKHAKYISLFKTGKQRNNEHE